VPGKLIAGAVRRRLDARQRQRRGDRDFQVELPQRILPQIRFSLWAKMG
jgi:hypothetical protein